MGVSDPHGLLDRNLRDFNTAYKTFVYDADINVDTATETERIAIEWYTASMGHPPAQSDLHHGYWRMLIERDRWGTMRNAFQEAWPLPFEPVPPGEMRRLVAHHHYFVCDGGDPRPVIRQRRDCGFNMLRTFIVGDWGDPNYLCRPQDHPDYYQKLAHLADIMRSEGMYWMPCAFCDTPRIFPTQIAQLAHWRQTCDALRPYPNVLLELVNENDVPINALDPRIFARPDGMLASHGSNGSQSLAVRPAWDFEVFHTNGAPEEQRKVGHNAMELCEGTPDWPGSNVPVITNETSRYPEVGMWTSHGASIERQEQLAYDSAAGAALQCAGSCFHSVNGKLSRMWDGNEERVARAWANGARSVPLEYQDGHYRRNNQGLTPDYPGVMRRYQRVLGDGRYHEVAIRW
jgi:hypothetical protein